MFEAFEEEKTRYAKYYIPSEGNYRIGRNVNSEIRYDSQLVSSYHATLHWSSKEVWIEDHNPPNGTYVNVVRISGKVLLHDGDLIYIVGLRIIIAQQVLAINQPNGLTVTKNISRITVQKATINEQTPHIFSKAVRKFSRSPRFANHVEPTEIQIDPPPAPVEIQSMPLAYLLGPSITMGVASVFTAVFTILNAQGDVLRIMPTLIMSFSMLVMTVLWPVLTRSHEKKTKIEAEKGELLPITIILIKNKEKYWKMYHDKKPYCAIASNPQMN